MRVWHGGLDTPRVPRRPIANEAVVVHVGSAPVEPGQHVWLELEVHGPHGASARRVEARWAGNGADGSRWLAELGAFPGGSRLRYELFGRSPGGLARGGIHEVTVGARVHVALLWHQHQPSYVDPSRRGRPGSHLWPWVRLHAARDYVGMPLLAAAEPAVRTTFNLTPALLVQVEDLLEGATDRAEALSRRAPASLDDQERDFLLRTFFDADPRHQIAPHPRYRDLLARRERRAHFSAADLRDLQVWFALAWCAVELREGTVTLPDGPDLTVSHLVRKGSGFGESDLDEVLGVQRRLLAAIVPVHRALEEAGAIEVTTTPFYHPILPLLLDARSATVDRPGATLPPPFRRPEDARAHVARAVDFHRARFGRPPRGMWPAEGAVSQQAVALFAEAGVRWIATDRGVLAASGRHGYRVEDPDVLCQAYRAEEHGRALSVFFRDTPLSDAIGFHYQGYASEEAAVAHFTGEVRARFARRFQGDDDRVLPIVLDGENAWGAFRDDARPFLRALYRALANDPEIGTTTFAGWLDGDASRHVPPHPLEAQTRVHRLHTGSWIDESGSAPGVELGTWVGEREENEAWRLLGEAREFLDREGATSETHPEAFEALWIAEGSDWFWWYGDDQDSGRDEEFDALFRMHLGRVYTALGVAPPPALARHIVPRAVTWSPGASIDAMQPGDRLVVRTTRPAVVRWWTDVDGAAVEQALLPVGGVMGDGGAHHQLALGPFPREVHRVFLVVHEEGEDPTAPEVVEQSAGR